MTTLRTGPGLTALMTLPGIGAKRALALATAYPTWDALTAATADDLAAHVGRATADRLTATIPTTPPVVDLPDGVRLVSILDPDYPTLLRTIPDPPPLLWVAGTLPPDGPALAIVGTRHPTRFGTSVAAAAAQAAARNSIAVISGLAHGIDATAHRATLDAGGRTWAVLGQGVDTLDATGLRTDLARDILRSGGGLIAEVPPGTPVAGHQLTRRNRLQSGLSQATLIAQSGVATANQPAGTMHTARYTVEQGRVLAVARPAGADATDERCAGNMALTHPHGMDPAAVHATGKIAAALATRRPAADLVIDGPQDLGILVAAVIDRYEAGSGSLPESLSESVESPALF